MGMVLDRSSGQGPKSRNRLFNALWGAVAGAMAWALTSDIPLMAVWGDALAAPLLCFTLMFSFGFLALAGPLGRRRALRVAAVPALLAAMMIAARQPRWENPADLWGSAWLLVALLVLALVPLPFAISRARGQGATYYPGLLEAGWTIWLRWWIALGFTGVFWLVLWLCSNVLGLLGISAFGNFLAHEGVAAVLTGAVLGLCAAVSHELLPRAVPKLAFSLLRMLLPVVAALTGLMLIGSILRDFAAQGAWLSSAEALLSLSVIGAFLISAALDRSDREASTHPIVRGSAYLMALFAPFLVAMAVVELNGDVARFGWTPARAGMVVVAGVLGFHALCGVWALRPWGAGFGLGYRRANIFGLWASVLSAVLWLSPIVNIEKLSAKDQAARYLSGENPAAGFLAKDFHTLGLAGDQALTQLRSLAEERANPSLKAALQVQDTRDFSPAQLTLLAAELEALLPVQPETAKGTRSAMLALMPSWQLTELRRSCVFKITAGRAGCLLVVGDFLPDAAGEEALLISVTATPAAVGVLLTPDGLETRGLAKAGAGRFDRDFAEELILRWHDSPPPMVPVRAMQAGQGPDGVYFGHP